MSKVYDALEAAGNLLSAVRAGYHEIPADRLDRQAQITREALEELDTNSSSFAAEQARHTQLQTAEGQAIATAVNNLIFVIRHCEVSEGLLDDLCSGIDCPIDRDDELVNGILSAIMDYYSKA